MANMKRNFNCVLPKVLKINCLLFISFVSSFCFSQSRSSELFGFVIQPKQQNISFVLKIKWDASFKVKGYSVTNKNKQDETSTLVHGHYDTIKEVLKIEEYKLDYTKSKADKSKMCYLKIELKSTKFAESKIWKGKFKGYYLDNQKCSEGSIILTERGTILKIMDSVKTQTIRKELNSMKAEIPQKIEYLGKDPLLRLKQNQIPVLFTFGMIIK